MNDLFHAIRGGEVKGEFKILNNIKGDLSHEIRKGEVNNMKRDLSHEIRGGEVKILSNI